MKTLVVGATGATGRLLVQRLLESGDQVSIIIRSDMSLPSSITSHENLTMTVGNVLEIPNEELTELMRGCDAIASCLGHNFTFKGIYGQPRYLVTDATSRLCEIAEQLKPIKPIKFILMNTTGNQNKLNGEQVSRSHKMLMSLIRALLPPQVDNERAAQFLQLNYPDSHPHIQWAAVRPDSLVDMPVATPYEVFASPTRDPLFNAGRTSRINVGNFIAELIADQKLWELWRGQMPVLYNQSA